MKKIISSLITVLILFSTVMPAFGLLSAENSGTLSYETLGIVDFDSNEQPTFFARKNIKTVDSAHGKSARFYYTSPIEGTADGDRGWVDNYALVNTAGTDYVKLKAMDKVKITFDINVVSITDATENFYVALICLTDKQVSNELGAMKGLTTLKTRLSNIAEIDCSTLSPGWNTIEGYATVAIQSEVGAKPYIVMYHNNDQNRNRGEIYLDNIKVEQPIYSAEEVRYSTVDFDSNEQTEFYASSKKSYFTAYAYKHQSEMKTLTGDDAAHGRVWSVKHLSGDESSFSSSSNPSALMLSNTEGTSALRYEKDDLFKISLEVKNAQAATVDATCDVFAAIVFDRYINTDVGYWGNGKGLYYYRANNLLLEIGRVDMTETGWQTLSGVIVVPDIDNTVEVPKLVLYTKSANSKSGVEIYVDNINLTPYEYNGEYNIDFDSNSQPRFYSVKTGFQSDNYFSNAINDGYLNAAAKMTSFDDGHGTAAVFTQIHTAHKNGANESWWPLSIRLCDTQGQYKVALKTGSKVTVSIDVKAETCTLDKFYVGLAFDSRNDCGSLGGTWETPAGLYKFYTEGSLTDIALVDGTKTEWQTYTATIYIPYHKNTDFVYLVAYSKSASSRTNNQRICFDNINLKVETPETYIDFETNGGKELEKIYCFEGQTPIIPKTEKEGYYFEDWYTDPELTQIYDYGAMPGESFKLYARWTDLTTIVPKNLVTGFEAEDYDSGVIPYTNQTPGEGMVIENPVSDNYNTDSVRILNDDKAAYEGKSTLYFENLDYEDMSVKYDGSQNGINAAALLNSDGTNFKVVAGTRYKLSFAQYINGGDFWNNKNCTISFVISNRIPVNGINNPNVTVAHQFTYSEGRFVGLGGQTGNWNFYEGYFESTVTGNLYMTMHSSSTSFIKVCKIDNLSIIASTDEAVSKVSFYNANNKLAHSYLGTPGDRFQQNVVSKQGYVFSGWVDENGDPFNSLVIPENDVNLYPTFVEAEDLSEGASIDWSEPVVADFDNTEEVSVFYVDTKNKADPDRYGYHMVYNDAENAHSGSNYMYFEEAGTWLEQGKNRRFRLYTEGTPGNYIWLDPNSQYKVTYYIDFIHKYDNVSKLYTVGFTDYGDNTVLERYAEVTYRRAHESYAEGWEKIEQIITVGDDPAMLGFELWAGNLTAKVDSVTVEKLGNVTVTFESNGGSAVDNIETLAYGKIVEPEYPTKEGYEFAGWFTDSALTDEFIFAENTVETNLKLYAKWVLPTPETPEEDDSEETEQPEEDGSEETEEPVETEEPEETEETEPQYKTVYETEYIEETVENEIIDSYLDESVNLKARDVPAKVKSNKVYAEQGGFPWWWIIVAVIAVLAVLSTVTVIIVKRKKRKKA